MPQWFSLDGTVEGVQVTDQMQKSINWIWTPSAGKDLLTSVSPYVSFLLSVIKDISSASPVVCNRCSYRSLVTVHKKGGFKF